MAMTDIQPLIVPVARVPANAAFTTRVMSSSNVIVSGVYLAQKSGNISHIGVKATAVAGSATVWQAGLETVSARQPTGTLLAASAKKTFSQGDLSTSAAMTWLALDTAQAVTLGDLVAPTIRYSSGTTPDASNSITIVRNNLYTGWPQYGHSPFASSCDASSIWTMDLKAPGVMMKYDDGTIHRGGAAVVSFTSESFGPATATTRFRGTKWTPSYKCRLCGLAYYHQPYLTPVIKLCVYDGTTLVSSLTLTTADCCADSSGYSYGTYWLDNITLNAGTAYRFVIQPVSGTSVLGTSHNFETLADLTLVSGGCCKTTSSGLDGDGLPTGWTDYNSGSNYAMFQILPIIDQIDLGGVIVVED